MMVYLKNMMLIILKRLSKTVTVVERILLCLLKMQEKLWAMPYSFRIIAMPPSPALLSTVRRGLSTSRGGRDSWTLASTSTTDVFGAERAMTARMLTRPRR